MIFEILKLGTNPVRTDRHRLAGTVTIDGVLGKRVVAVIDRRTLTPLAATISDPITGAWTLSSMPEYPERQLLVAALDNTGNYNAEVADYISQVLLG